MSNSNLSKVIPGIAAPPPVQMVGVIGLGIREHAALAVLPALIERAAFPIDDKAGLVGDALEYADLFVEEIRKP